MIRILEIGLIAYAILVTIGSIQAGTEAFIFFLLSLLYLIGGFWLFNPEEKKRIGIPVVGGLVFSVAVFSLPYHIHLNHLQVYDYLPAANLVFLPFIGVHCFLKGRLEPFYKFNRGLFIRSFIIALVTGFFAYLPADFPLFNKTVLFLNDKVANHAKQKMYYYEAKFEEAKESNNWKEALIYAKKSSYGAKAMMAYPKLKEQDSLRKMDRALLAIKRDSVSFPVTIKRLHKLVPQKQVNKIFDSYIQLYKVYNQRAKELENNYSLESSLKYSQKAYHNLKIFDLKGNKYWQVKKAKLLGNIGDIHKKLKNSLKADSLYNSGINLCKKHKAYGKKILANLNSKRAILLADKGFYDISLKYLEKSIKYYKQLGNTETLSSSSFFELNLLLAKSYLKVEKFSKAITLIKEIYHMPSRNKQEFCVLNDYYGIALFRQNRFSKADSFLSTAIQCHKSDSFTGKASSSVLGSLINLSKSKITVAEFDSARKLIDKGLNISKKLINRKKPVLAEFLATSARLNYRTGHYKSAEKQFKEALDKHLSFEQADVNKPLVPVLLADFADFHTRMRNFKKARFYADSSLSMGKRIEQISSVGGNRIINTSAYNYYIQGRMDLADSLYHKSINLVKTYDLTLSQTKANALNGLALVQMERGKYQNADSLFKLALRLNKQLFNKEHPNTAKVMTNFSALKVKQGKLAYAKSLLEKSKSISHTFYKNDHIVFADIHVVAGDLALKRDKLKTAESHYQKALKIYLKNFDKKHYRVKEVKARLTNIEFEKT
jgi:hypothetical protein